MPTLTLTRPGDTWHGIAQEHFGHNYSEQNLQDLLKANECSLYYWNQQYQLQNSQQHDVFCALPPYRAIWLPKNCHNLTLHDENLLRKLDAMPQVARCNLARMEAVGVSPYYAIAAAHVIQQVQAARKAGNAQNADIPESAKYGAGATITAGDTLGKLGKEDIEDILKSLKDLESKLQIWSRSRSKLFEADLQETYNKALKALNKGISKCAIEKTGFLLDNKEKLMRSARRKSLLGRGVVVITEENLRQIESMLTFFEFMPVAAWIADLGVAAIAVLNAIDNNKDPFKAGWKEATNIAAWRFGGYSGEYACKEILPKLAKEAIPAVLESSVSEEAIVLVVGVLVGVAAAPELLIIFGAVAGGAGAAYAINKFVDYAAK